MDISPIISSSIVQTSLFGTVGSRAVTFLFDPSATTSASSVDIVDISGLGQLLSASAIFETGILEAAEANQASFPTVIAATQFFVEAFNSFLQSDSLQSSLGGSLGNLFIQSLSTRATAGSGDGESILASLSGIGINLQTPTIQNVAGQLAIDFETLQSAFDADQLGTVSVLAQTTRLIGQLATEFTNLFVRVGDFSQDLSGVADTATLNGLLAATETTETTAAAGATETTAAAATAEATAVTAATGATVATVAAVAAGTTATTETAAATEATVAAAAAETTTATGTTATAEATATPGTTAITGTAASPETVAATGTAAATAATATTVTTAATNAAATIPPATPPPFATEAVGTTGSRATPITARLPAATAETGAAAVTPPAATRLPATAAAGTTGLIATPVAARSPATPATAPTTTAAATVAPVTVPQNLINPINPIIDASNPAVAAAIAAYHVVDGIFDSSKHPIETSSESFPGYSEIRPVTPIKPTRLDLYA